ncbi:MAG: tocopherol cyclase family protein [Erysipelotrichaceae bacterium]|nr:tocopherol cyclase family protein [Erysipelotrichaceae bacterium]
MAINRIWKPETFQGHSKKSNYFEGWYFKLIDQSRETIIAMIPGIAIGNNKQDSHCFIQFIDATSGKTEYFRFPLEEFSSDINTFDVSIGVNRFSDNEINVNLNNGKTTICGQLRFSNITKYPKSFLHPGIMGPFSFMPGMECYHGIVNISHTISGNLTINGINVEMTGGEGYIEKDWGRSFPNSWIWLQANHFANSKSSFMFSVADIPWLNSSFIGLISFLKTDSSFYNFSTYNGSKIDHLSINDNTLTVILKQRGKTLKFTAKYSQGGILKAPKNGLMKRDIEESITAEIDLLLIDRNGVTIFEDTSKWVGMELASAFDLQK